MRGKLGNLNKLNLNTLPGNGMTLRLLLYFLFQPHKNDFFFLQIKYFSSLHTFGTDTVFDKKKKKPSGFELKIVE